MRIGAHLGPFYASTSTRRRKGQTGCAPIVGLALLVGGAVWLFDWLRSWAGTAGAWILIALVVAAIVTVVVAVMIRPEP